MRSFYIFRIKDEYVSLTKNNPYHLYRILDYIYHMEESNIKEAIKIFSKIINDFNSKAIDIKVFKNFRDNYSYTKYRNIHQINDVYKREQSKLIVKNKFLLLQSNTLKPLFIDSLKDYDNLFCCDFENKDYFWLNNIYV